MSRQHQRQLARLRRKFIARRPTSSKHTYVIETGSAGFIRLYMDGERIQPKNFRMEVRARGNR